MTLGEAVAIATRAHEGQTDKAGEPYIEHPLRVLRYVATDQERLVAVLHDVLEDTQVTAEDLSRQVCPRGVVAAVQLLSKQAGDTYERFIGRIHDSGNELAINVKLADLADNADMSRLTRLPIDEWMRLRAKYAAATKSLVGGATLAPFVANTRCAICGKQASHVEVVESPGDATGWRFIFRGIEAGKGAGDAITSYEAGRLKQAFAEPHRYGRIRTADLDDDAGFCKECGVFYCEGPRRPSTPGFGRCPNEHGKSLNPHWSPDF